MEIKTIKSNIISYILTLVMILYVIIIMFIMIPLFGIMDYYSESVEWEFTILLFISFSYLIYLFLMNVLVYFFIEKSRIINFSVTTTLSLFVELWVIFTFFDISHLILKYGGLEFDRIFALLCTIAIGITVLLLTVSIYLVIPIQKLIKTKKDKNSN